VTSEGHDSPEGAAMEGFPARYCHIVAIRVNGDDAYALLDTGPVDQPYLYGVNCKRRNSRWFWTAGVNGPSWGLTDETRNVGALSFWDAAPAAADRVRVEFKGQIVEEPVVESAYLVVFWNQPQTFSPGKVAFRIDGQWIDWG
jgi:hypothetical protein